MSIIEKAVQRLDELKRAGISLPGGAVPERCAADTNRVETGSQHVQAALASPTPPLLSDAAAPAASSSKTSSYGSSEPSSRSVEIDLDRLRAAGMLTPEAQRSQLADEYRVIKRPLIGNAQGRGATPLRHGNLIMITSAMPGEGKSFTSVNLAISIAMEMDNTVLLVDADVARPSLLNVLGLPPAKGLMDVLVHEENDLGDVLLRTNVEKLSILPAGTPHQRATELLASDAMIQLLDEMASRYSDRIIIFDSPPLLVTTESRVLASHMGQIVVVVEAERTTHAAVKQALSTIEACPVRMTLLNKSARASVGNYYGYYGYGGYGYGR